MDNPVLQQPILFISDVHLGGFSDNENQRIENELIELLNYCQCHQIHLAILGDLFDYWMEYPKYIPELGEKLLDRFEEFNKALGPTLFITGNHDNWTREHLLQRGFFLEHEHALFTINNLKMMALHGDGLSDPTLKLERPLMHRLIRSAPFVRFYQTLFPPRVGITIMKYFSRFTRNLEETDKAAKLNQWARRQLETTEVDILLCGHDHIPRRKQFSFGTYINLGTFYTHRTMAFYNNESISLVCWEPDTQSLKTIETN